MLSWRTTKNEITESSFLNGITIFKKLNESLYGKINNMFNTIFTDNEKKIYTLPKVVVIGNESTGKSSLLENITKCKLFPRDNKLCTKCPIHVKMQTGERYYSVTYTDENNKPITISIGDRTQIYRIVKEFMEKMPDNHISENEIVIHITDEDIPNFEFLDLPGIRAYPEKISQDSINLCKKYLADKNAIVLCVVPITETRLTSQRSIALITEMGLEENCILAFTMVDKLNFQDIEDFLIKRITNNSDELVGLNFYGYVAIMNRTYTNNISMQDNDIKEQQWFNDNIIKLIPDEYLDLKHKIIDNITISKLVEKMNNLYTHFIKTNWKPLFIDTIDIKINNLKDLHYNLRKIDIDTNYVNKSIYDEIQTIYSELDFKDSITLIRGITQNISLLNIENSDKLTEKYFDIIGKSGDEYKVTIGKECKCSCLDYKNRKRRCKHIYFILIKVLEVLPKYENKLTYTEDELLLIFNILNNNDNIIKNNYNYNNDEYDIYNKNEREFTIYKNYIIHQVEKYSLYDLEDIFKKLKFYFDNSEYKLFRYTNIVNDINSKISNRLNKLIKNEKERIINMCINKLTKLYFKNNLNTISFEKLNNNIYNLYKLFVIYPTLTFHINYNEKDYIECESYQKQRDSINENISNLLKKKDLYKVFL